MRESVNQLLPRQGSNLNRQDQSLPCCQLHHGVSLRAKMEKQPEAFAAQLCFLFG